VLHAPAIALLLAEAAEKRRPGRFGAVLVAGACTYLLPVTVLRSLFHRQEHWPDVPWTLQFWALVPALASLVLVALLLQRLRRAGMAHVQ
jgi:hypothetical protein